MKGLRRIASIGLLSGLAGLIGCETDDGSSITIRDATPLVTLGAREGFGIAAQNSAAKGDVRKAQSYQSASNLAGTGAEWYHDEKVADRGRGDVIVNNYGNGNERINSYPHYPIDEFGSPIHAMFTGWDDRNGNERIDGIDELVGVGTHFSPGQKVYLGCFSPVRGTLIADISHKNEIISRAEEHRVSEGDFVFWELTQKYVAGRTGNFDIRWIANGKKFKETWFVIN